MSAALFLSKLPCISSFLVERLKKICYTVSNDMTIGSENLDRCIQCRFNNNGAGSGFLLFFGKQEKTRIFKTAVAFTFCRHVHGVFLYFVPLVLRYGTGYPFHWSLLYWHGLGTAFYDAVYPDLY